MRCPRASLIVLAAIVCIRQITAFATSSDRWLDENRYTSVFAKQPGGQQEQQKPAPRPRIDRNWYYEQVSAIRKKQPRLKTRSKASKKKKKKKVKGSKDGSSSSSSSSDDEDCTSKYKGTALEELCRKSKGKGGNKKGMMKGMGKKSSKKGSQGSSSKQSAMPTLSPSIEAVIAPTSVPSVGAPSIATVVPSLVPGTTASPIGIGSPTTTPSGAGVQPTPTLVPGTTASPVTMQPTSVDQTAAPTVLPQRETMPPTLLPGTTATPVTSQPTGVDQTAAPTVLPQQETMPPTLLPGTTSAPVTMQPAGVDQTAAPTTVLPQTEAPIPGTATLAPTPETGSASPVTTVSPRPSTMIATASPTVGPTLEETTPAPTPTSVTESPEGSATTSSPTAGSTARQTAQPTSSETTPGPTLSVESPTTNSPTAGATARQTAQPTSIETTPGPSSPTLAPVESPTTSSPTLTPVESPTTSSPTLAPVESPTTNSPTLAPVESPTTSSPTMGAASPEPTAEETMEPTMGGDSSPEPTAEETMEPTMGGDSSPEPTAEETMEPTMGGAPDPTAAPTVTVTSSPNSVTATVFSVIYTIPSSSFTDQDFEAAQMTTLQYLEDFLVAEFASRPETEIDQFIGTVLQSNSGPPPEAVFTVEVVFTADSSFIPTQQELDILLEVAVGIPLLLGDLAELPTENPFSGTTEVEYIPRFDLDLTKQGDKNGIMLETDFSEPSEEHPVFDDAMTRYDETTFKITPFSIVYISAGGDPNDDETTVASRVTLAYLESFLRETFDSVEPDIYRFLAGSGLGAKSNTTTIGYIAGVAIDEESSLSVTRADLDMVVESAFLPPFVKTLISVLQALPRGNPYSTTTSVEFRSVPTDTDETESPSKSFSTTAITGTALAALLVLGLAASCLAILRRKDCFFSKGKKRRPKDIESSPEEQLVEIISEDSPLSAASGSLQSFREHDQDEDTVIEFNVVDTLLRDKRDGETSLFRSPFAYTEERVAERNKV